MIDDKSETLLAPLYPPFADKLRQLLAALGEGWVISEGFRSFAEQDAFYEQGRSRPGALITRDRAGYSGHNYGMAAHVRPAEASNEQYFRLATEAKNLELKWGGNDETGKFIEMSRVEMLIATMDGCLAIFKKGGLPAVWAAFDANLGINKAPEPIAEPSAPIAAAEPKAEESESVTTSVTESEPEAELPAREDSPVVVRHKKE